jgi:hypothetical protein
MASVAGVVCSPKAKGRRKEGRGRVQASRKREKLTEFSVVRSGWRSRSTRNAFAAAIRLTLSSRDRFGSCVAARAKKVRRNCRRWATSYGLFPKRSAHKFVGGRVAIPSGFLDAVDRVISSSSPCTSKTSYEGSDATLPSFAWSFCRRNSQRPPRRSPRFFATPTPDRVTARSKDAAMRQYLHESVPHTASESVDDDPNAVRPSISESSVRHRVCAVRTARCSYSRLCFEPTSPAPSSLHRGGTEARLLFVERRDEEPGPNRDSADAVQPGRA